MYIYIIPGNPGFSNAYTEFKESLSFEFTTPISNIICNSHPGFSPETKLESVSLENITRYHEAEITKLANDMIELNDQMIICGHSLGCYIALDVAIKMQNSDIKKYNTISTIQLVAPATQFIATTPGGFKVNSIIKPLYLNGVRKVCDWISGIHSIAPFVDWVIGFPNANEIMDPILFDNVLILWDDEQKSMLHHPNTNQIKEKIRVICAAHDDWVPSCDVEFMKQMYPCVSESDEFGHNFVLYPDQCDAVSKMILLGDELMK